MMSETARAIRLLAWCVLWGCFFMALAMASGCTPFVAYQHLSDPAVSGDGYDLACVGLKQRDSRLAVRAAWCENARGGSLATAAVEYDLIK